jgi:hypothetical protein
MSTATTESKKLLKRVLIPMDEALLAAIEEYRKAADWPHPSQAEAVRQLIKKGLAK